ASTERLRTSVNDTVGRVRFVRRASYALHGFLVGMHFALLIINLLHLEDKAEVPLTRDGPYKDLTSTVITVSGTLFATLYGALLIWLTQRLTLRRLLTSKQTLTAMHDEYNSWIGLGSALLTLCSQRKIRSALGSIGCIACYLICATILHITIPAMLSLQVSNLDIPVPQTMALAYPDVHDILYSYISPRRYHGLFSDASSMLPYIVRQGISNETRDTIGLKRASMYDRVPSGVPNNTISIDATSFNVTCGLIEGLTIAKPAENTDVRWFEASHVYPNGTTQHNLRIEYVTQDNTMMIGFADAGKYDYTPALNRSFYLYGAFDIEDSAGSLLSPLILPSVGDTPASNISIVGCDLYGFNHTMDYDTTMPVVSFGALPPLRTSSYFSAWQPQNPATPENLDLLDLWSMAVVHQFRTAYGLGEHSETKLGFLEKYMGAILDLNLPGWSLSDAPRGRAKLHDVENALSRLAAALFWSLNEQGAGHRILRYRDIVLHNSETSVQRLHLSRISVTIGLAGSVLLMATNAVLVRPRESRTVGAVDILDSLGLLQIIWFVRGRPEVLRVIGRVENPTEDDLRLAGMFTIMQPDVRASLGPSRGEEPHELALFEQVPSTPTHKWQEDQSSPRSSHSAWDARA
ncbi:hypothetical protein HDZ31DRAFT_35745, partial [Schizophyllum fasciatum]